MSNRPIPVQYKFLSITVAENEDLADSLAKICNNMLRENFMLKDYSVTMLPSKDRDVMLSFEKY